MAILGNGGILELSRATPKAMAMSVARLNIGATPVSISLANQGYWTGDRISLASADGLPLDGNADGYADCPDGHAMYRGSQWESGPSHAFYVGADTDASPFYKQQVYDDTLLTESGDTFITQSGDTLLFSVGDENEIDRYNTSATTGLTTTFDAYIYRDELDRITLFSTEAAAYANDISAGIALKKVNCTNFILAAYNSNSGYTAALNAAAASLEPLTLSNSEQNLDGLFGLSPLFAPDRQWLMQCELTEWALNVDATSLDITAIGETFGENVKALVRGSGTLQFLVDHRQQANEADAMTLLRLVLMTENQSNTNAKFYLYKNRNEPAPQIAGSAYYQCDLLLTNTRVDTRAADIIAGTADFVATSDIKLKVLAG